MNSLRQVRYLNALDYVTEQISDDVVFVFLHNFSKTYLILEQSGAFSDETPQSVRTNIALKITAENIRIASAEYKKELENARYFA
jgi:hypothetical protein